MVLALTFEHYELPEKYFEVLEVITALFLALFCRLEIKYIV
jgi:hypothetical protein